MLGETHWAVGLFGGGLSKHPAGIRVSWGCKQPPEVYPLSPLRPQYQTPIGQAIHRGGLKKQQRLWEKEANCLWIIIVQLQPSSKDKGQTSCSGEGHGGRCTTLRKEAWASTEGKGSRNKRRDLWVDWERCPRGRSPKRKVIWLVTLGRIRNLTERG